MGDRVWVQFPVWDIISVCDQPPKSTQPGHPFVGKRDLRSGSYCYTRAISQRFRDEGLI